MRRSTKSSSDKRSPKCGKYSKYFDYCVYIGYNLFCMTIYRWKSAHVSYNMDSQTDRRTLSVALPELETA